MTPTLLEKNAPEPDPVDEAITALTAAARGQRIIGAGTANEHSVPTNFAGTLSRILASVAANVGGIEALLQGRPESWEADYVRQLLRSTVGENEEYLLQYRTELVGSRGLRGLSNRFPPLDRHRHVRVRICDLTKN